MKYLLGFILFFSTLSFLNAQDTDPIVTDRPTQSAASAVVPKGKLLIEYGYLNERANTLNNVTYGNFLVRFGLFEGVEFRLTQNYLGERVNIAPVRGLSPITIGTKIHLIEEEGGIPQTSIIGQVTLANGNEAFRPGEPIPEVRLNFSNTLSDYLSLGYNIGAVFPEDNATGLYTLVLGYSFSPGWTFFAEPYGFFNGDSSDHRFNSGLIYLVSSRIQFDVSAGIGLSDISPDRFMGFGAAIGF